MRGVFAGVGGIALIALIALGLLIESLIPGAIIHFAAGVEFVKAVLWAALAQLALCVLGCLVVLGFGLAFSD